MPKGVPKNGKNQGWFTKGCSNSRKGQRKYIINCKFCGTIIQTSDKRKKFCNHSCSMKFRWNTGNLNHIIEILREKNTGIEKNQKIRNNISDGLFKGKTKRIKGRSENYWRKLARAKIRNPNNLDVHHIDGDITNNNLKNLQLLTRSKHTKLHHSQGDIHWRGLQ